MECRCGHAMKMYLDDETLYYCLFCELIYDGEYDSWSDDLSVCDD